MANTRRSRVGSVVSILFAAFSLGIAVHAEERLEPARTIVVHVGNHPPVAADDLARAQRHVERVYDAVGVRLQWHTGAAALAPPDGMRHVDVVILSKAATTQMERAYQETGGTLGRASAPTRRAYVYFNRVAAHARRTGTGLPGVLGLVIAHELGHLLLPANSHTASGIMRSSWSGALPGRLNFTKEQAHAIRASVDEASRSEQLLLRGGIMIRARPTPGLDIVAAQ